jgi:hypothetical protein
MLYEMARLKYLLASSQLKLSLSPYKSARDAVMIRMSVVADYGFEER